MRTIFAIVFAAVSLFGSFVYGNDYPNKFHCIYGCKQTNAVNNYNHPVNYIPMENFENAGAGVNSTFFRIGIFGKSDAIIRFSKFPMPYNKNIVHEIVVGAGANHFTEIRRQTRFNKLVHTNHVLKKIRTPDILPEMEPFVLQVEFVQDGSVRLTRDGDTEPFLEFCDPDAEISYKYIGFSNWLSKMIYFFDCPVYNFDVRFNNLNML
ncbi:uncharacterized protein LOC134220071 [Armigeres subalbatus]|uniref:uncharacterized protein LOC134220071 n=1 Tax=Armigeres subalbatus TaxID=124917 RepID=UPI002ED499D1